MDPNLTLAHITHNTAVVLLHQGIAYPSANWERTPIRLPSTSSAETCLAAATEVIIIAAQFLACTDTVTNPQFSFCLFICGRMLLAHATFYRGPLSPHFDSLLDSLWEISRRWTGPKAPAYATKQNDNLASKFAMRLVQARNNNDSSAVDISQSAFSEKPTLRRHEDASRSPMIASRINMAHGADDVRPMNKSNPCEFEAPVVADSTTNYPARGGLDGKESPESILLAFPPLPLAFQPQRNADPDNLAGSRMEDAGTNGTAVYRSREHNIGFAMPSDGHNFQLLDSFWEYSVPPTDRISMFSHE